jgi:CheY-like chemotaxis protein
MSREKQFIGICQYPSTVMFVDDNISFLKNIELGIDATVPFKKFENAHEALEFLNNTYHIKPFPQRYFNKEVDDEFDRFTVDLNIRDIHHEMYYKDRFSEISVLVIDFMMPKINGLEFCQSLNKTNIKKILLTGEADTKLAVEAFNKKLIDRFISKGTDNLIEVINQSVQEMQHAYFIDSSKKILDIAHASKKHLNCLYDKKFNDFFLNILQQNQIVEYYLFDEAGSFILLDAKGKPYILAIKNKKALQEMHEFATEFSEPSSNVANALTTGSHIPFFYSDDDLNTPPEEWDPYFHAAEKIDGDLDTYYCALIKNIDLYDIDRENILSYQKFNQEN